ncbi:proton-coupled folate transporter-like isoform X1 [Lytechinus pictus]|uniref:proton-coupled folate transporter-like isoform X1 n=1 Tax=Lytechinus pictus TaxID=7653 RepID=UPI00240DE26F|nr:proton-coupled folate transporter-like [Lytechinus pictus]
MSGVLRVVLFIFMGGLAMQWPITQHLIFDMACHRLGYSDDVCSDLGNHTDAEHAVQGQASTIMTYQSVFCDIPGAVASLILGAQSDKVGRKRIMLLPIMGVTLLLVILLLGSMIHTTSIVFIMASSVALGISGGIGTFMSTVTNYITDITPEEQRTETLSKTLPFMGLGVIVGLISSGILTQQLGVSAAYFIDFILMLVVLYLVTFHLKESKPTTDKSKDTTSHPEDQSQGVGSAIWENLTAGVKVFTSEKDGFVRIQLGMIVLQGMVGFAIMVAEGNLLMLYTKKSPFTWSPSMYSIFTATKNALGIVGQAVGTILFFKVMGAKSIRNDFILLLMASSAGFAINFIVASATTTTMMMMTTALVMFATPGQSAAGSITSKLVNPEHKGAFTSLGTFLNTITVPIAGFILNSIYSYTVHYSPGIVFLCIAAAHAVILTGNAYVVLFTKREATHGEKTD